MNSIIPTIAIADNHRLMRQAIAGFLAKSGFQVILQAVNGRNLLEGIRSENILPDICLLDIEMPEMDGYETATCLQREFPSIKILGITVFENESKKEKMLHSGAVGLLIKSHNPEEWLETIRLHCYPSQVVC